MAEDFLALPLPLANSIPARLSNELGATMLKILTKNSNEELSTLKSSVSYPVKIGHTICGIALRRTKGRHYCLFCLTLFSG